MSRKAINEMETGKAPIERRTELAALYLAEHPDVIDLAADRNSHLEAAS